MPKFFIEVFVEFPVLLNELDVPLDWHGLLLLLAAFLLLLSSSSNARWKKYADRPRHVPTPVYKQERHDSFSSVLEFISVAFSFWGGIFCVQTWVRFGCCNLLRRRHVPRLMMVEKKEGYVRAPPLPFDWDWWCWKKMTWLCCDRWNKSPKMTCRWAGWIGVNFWLRISWACSSDAHDSTHVPITNWHCLSPHIHDDDVPSHHL